MHMMYTPIYTMHKDIDIVCCHAMHDLSHALAMDDLSYALAIGYA